MIDEEVEPVKRFLADEIGYRFVVQAPFHQMLERLTLIVA